MESKRKNQNLNFKSDSKGITLIVLILTVSIMIMILGIVAYEATYLFNQNYEKNEIAKLQLIQVKAKTIREEIEFNNDETLLKGIKYAEIQDSNIKNSVDELFNTEEFENMNKENFYYLDKVALKELNLDSIEKYEDRGYLVDYNTCDVVILEGIKLEDGTNIYKLSDTVNSNQYIIEYDANGGYITTTKQKKIKDIDIILIEEIPERENYTFKGWNTNKNSNEVEYQPGDKYTKNVSVKLYAVWKKNETNQEYTLTFDANGGIVSKNSISKYFGEEITLPIPIRIYEVSFDSNGGELCNSQFAEYYFNGWYTSKDGGQKREYIKMPSYDETLYAKWTSKQIVLPNTEKIGYTLEGWYDNEVGNNGTGNKEGSAGEVYTPFENKNLYAKWIENSYKIVFDSNGGLGTMGSLDAKYTETVILAENTFAKEGYTFAGWNTAKDGNGTEYKDKAGVSKLTTSTSITLYAQWKEVKKVPTTSILQNELEIVEGNTSSIQYTYDGDGIPEVITSSSSNATATIDTNKKEVTILGVAEGKATITIEFPEGINYTEGISQTIDVTVTEANYVSSGIYYTFLSKAVAAVNNDETITVLKNTEESETTIDKNITLDLNKKTIDLTNRISISDSYNVNIKGEGTITGKANHTLRNYGILNLNEKVNIQNTSLEGYAISNSGILNANSGDIQSSYRGIYNTGTTNIDGANVLANDIAIRNLDNGIVNVNSGTVKALAADGAGTHGIYNTSINDNAVNINGGTVVSKSDLGEASGIRNATNGKITVTGGNIIAESTSNYAIGIFSSEGTIEVIDGEILGNSTNNYARGIAAFEGEIIMNGGNVYGKGAGSTGSYGIMSWSNVAEKENLVQITITGGNITGESIDSVGGGISLSGVEGATSVSTINIDGVCTIKGISSTNLGIGIYNLISTGDFSISKGANISGVSTAANAYGINNQKNNKVVVTGTNSFNTQITGNSTNKNGYGIYNKIGTLKIWNTEDNNIDINENYPLITGSTYGVYAVDGSEFQWYDGKIVGKTSLEGKEPVLPDKCSVYTTITDSIQTSIIKLNTSITFNPNNEEEVEVIEYPQGVKFGELPDQTKEGYTFVGWFTEKTGGTQITSDTVVPEQATTYYAHWNVKQYTITYDLEEGEVEGNPTTYTIESNEITLKNPTKELYVFKGWIGTDLQETTMEVKIPKGSIGNRSYTATWEEAIASATQNSTTTYHESVQDAVDEITENGTVTLLKDVTVTSPVEIQSEKTIEYNTNGKKLTSSSSEYAITNNGILTVNGNGVIKNSLSNKYAINNIGTLNANSGTIEGSYGGILNNGELYVKGATISGTSRGILNSESGTININSGKVQAINENGGTAYAINTDSNIDNAVTINGGEIIAKSELGDESWAMGIRNTTNKIITVTDGNISASAYFKARGIQTYEGKVNVSGGEIYSKTNTGNSFGILTYNNSTTIEKSAEVNIAGGTITGESISSNRSWSIVSR